MPMIREKEIASIKTFFLSLELFVLLGPNMLKDENIRVGIYSLYYLIFYKLEFNKKYEYVKKNVLDSYYNYNYNCEL